MINQNRLCFRGEFNKESSYNYYYANLWYFMVLVKEVLENGK